MPKTAAFNTAPESLTDEQLSELVAVEHWAPLGEHLERLVAMISASTAMPERTTILTWIYQRQGVMSFGELAERITGFENVTAKKRQLRASLRGLEKLLLISVVNFAGDAASDTDAQDDVIGKNSLISLTWTGMVWLRRAWAARARLASEANIRLVHQNMVEEEDAGKANDPFWVENISTVDPEGPALRAERIKAVATPGIASVFDLAANGKKRR
jgi:hypothetical protein